MNAGAAGAARAFFCCTALLGGVLYRVWNEPESRLLDDIRTERLEIVDPEGRVVAAFQGMTGGRVRLLIGNENGPSVELFADAGSMSGLLLRGQQGIECGRLSTVDQETILEIRSGESSITMDAAVEATLAIQGDETTHVVIGTEHPELAINHDGSTCKLGFVNERPELSITDGNAADVIRLGLAAKGYATLCVIKEDGTWTVIP